MKGKPNKVAGKKVIVVIQKLAEVPYGMGWSEILNPIRKPRKYPRKAYLAYCRFA